MFSRSLTSAFILRLPKSNIVYPIILPTLYLWVVDTLALKRGTWVIVEGTKLGIHLWDGLEIEYARLSRRVSERDEWLTSTSGRPFSSSVPIA